MLGQPLETSPDAQAIFPFYIGFERGGEFNPLGEGVGVVTDGLNFIKDQIPLVGSAMPDLDIGNDIKNGINHSIIDGAEIEGLSGNGAAKDEFMRYIDAQRSLDTSYMPENGFTLEQLDEWYGEYYYPEDTPTIMSTGPGRLHWDMNMFEVMTGLNYIQATMLFSMWGILVGLCCFFCMQPCLKPVCSPIPFLGRCLCGKD